MGGESAADKERAMREHEREARERDEDERSGGGGDSTMGNALGEDEEGGTPAPPGNIPAGGQSG